MTTLSVRLPLFKPKLKPELSATSFVVYRGPSAFNGEPIVGIVTGVASKTSQSRSKNVKTGPMAQLYILAASEVPFAAQKSGADAAVCGDCTLRFSKAKPMGSTYCYVNVAFGASTAWRANAQAPVRLEACASDLQRHDLHLRLGAYGDPAALPEAVIAALVKGSAGHTGYTHDWRDGRSSWLKTYAMASVETEADSAKAQAAGWRTFRIIASSKAELAGNEIICPAATHEKHCVDCRLCDGARAVDHRKVIAIPVHGRQLGTARSNAARKANAGQQAIGRNT